MPATISTDIVDFTATLKLNETTSVISFSPLDCKMEGGASGAQVVVAAAVWPNYGSNS